MFLSEDIRTILATLIELVSYVPKCLSLAILLCVLHVQKMTIMKNDNYADKQLILP